MRESLKLNGGLQQPPHDASRPLVHSTFPLLVATTHTQPETPEDHGDRIGRAIHTIRPYERPIDRGDQDIVADRGKKAIGHKKHAELVSTIPRQNLLDNVSKTLLLLDTTTTGKTLPGGP